MNKRQKKNFPVAIVGMHGQFPDAYDVKDFWTNLYEGNDTVRLIPKERWDWEKLFGSSANESENTTINCAAFMPMVDRFDCGFFGIMPREAEAMDPQQRLFMQTAYAALEDAGYAPGSLSGSNTGVFVGIGNADYPMMMRHDGAAFDIYRATGLALTCIANRVSFSLDIHGPSESIDTACSGSLVAIHHAIQSMQNSECERAIVGGVNVLAGPDLFIAFDKAGMLSKSARCRTFDATANGYVRGEGVAALVLCPLDVAEKNGDYIYGVIQGSAVNHGGRAHSFTAPNATAQAQVVKTAWENSGKDFHQACMIETHGTGTPLGDPIEVNGLKKVSKEFGFDEKDAAKQNIALGALKSHVGHMEATAGVGGVIKTILSMKYRVIPKNLNYSTLNPHIDLNGTPYYVPIQNVNLSHVGKNKEGAPTELLAGVSSFGFGGVNSHIVIQSYDAIDQAIEQPVKKQAPEQEASVPYLIPLSGKDKNSLHSRVRQLIEFLEVSCNETDKDAAYLSVMASLCASLNVEADPDSLQPITLTSINTSPFQWMNALKALAPLLGRMVDISEVQDCVSLQEASRKIIRNTHVHSIIKAPAQLHLCSRVAVPEAEIRAVGLGRIAYSLMQGRDNFKERMACIAHNKEELLKLLNAFIEAPDATHLSLWTHSIRANDPLLDKPVARTAHSDMESLAAWAAWWVATKSAVLNWDVLYPKSTKPRKFPLPAYPFRLDRIWYKAAAVIDRQVQIGRQAQPQTQPEEKAPIQQATYKAQEPIFLPSRIAAAWDACIKQSQLIIPSSVMSLAYLLDYSIYKNQSIYKNPCAPVVLEDVIFGQPCSLQDKQLVFSYSPGTDSGIVQCLSLEAGRKVLAQAALKNRCGNIPAAIESGLDSTTLIPIDRFLAQLEGNYLSLGPVLHCINKVYASDQKLKVELVLPKWKAKDGRFWVPIMASMLSGLAHLNQQQNKPFQLPWKIQSITFNPDHSLSAKSLYLIIERGRTNASVIAIDEASNIVLKLEGIVLRDSAAVRLPRRIIEEPEMASSDQSEVYA